MNLKTVMQFLLKLKTLVFVDLTNKQVQCYTDVFYRCAKQNFKITCSEFCAKINNLRMANIYDGNTLMFKRRTYIHVPIKILKRKKM